MKARIQERFLGSWIVLFRSFPYLALRDCSLFPGPSLCSSLNVEYPESSSQKNDAYQRTKIGERPLLHRSPSASREGGNPVFRHPHFN